MYVQDTNSWFQCVLNREGHYVQDTNFWFQCVLNREGHYVQDTNFWFQCVLNREGHYVQDTNSWFQCVLNREIHTDNTASPVDAPSQNPEWPALLYHSQTSHAVHSAITDCA